MNKIYYLNRHIVGLAIGYSKAIVVDMAFCLQVTLLIAIYNMEIWKKN